MIQVSAITIYPIKSCAGIQLSSAVVCETGFLHDREYMIVDDSGVFITQRQYAKLALIQPEIIDSGIALSAPGMNKIELKKNLDGDIVQTRVWDTVCFGIDQGSQVAQWLTAYIGKECKLLCLSPKHERKILEKYRTREDEVTSFADSMPFLVVSEESLEDLNSRLEEKLPINRFRPNIVVSGGLAFQEDLWKKIKIGNTVLRSVKQCSRCDIITINQKTLEKNNEPLDLLGSYRSKPKGIVFGQHYMHIQSDNSITVGDIVEIIEI
jgi:uncharacterized protein YcbX